MDQHVLITILLFLAFFLGFTAFLQTFSNKTAFPYTVALLVVGFIAQIANESLHLDLHLTLPTDIIYFILLPVLLFEAAQHINFHQFRLQFKTISFLATFGLLISIFVIAGIVAYAIGVPLGVALLFGAVISATDPIAVLTLFKTLGAPRRLSLLADGESMFNDATGVIAFKLVSVFVITSTAFQADKLISSLGNFVYIFVGSMVFGTLFGYVASQVINKVKGDRVVVTALTAATAFGSFVASEHFFHLSGVISTVMAGIVLGNLGKTKIKATVAHFLEEFWEYLAFFSVSIVFFFAAFNLDLAIFTKNPINLIIAVIAVLVGRAVSVYVSCFLSNKLPFFKDEPNVPLSWQHILNWGGLRGVIPLVLAYSLPESFAFREEILAFTLAALVFTLIINGLTIQWLLKKLRLHIPKKEEAIAQKQQTIFETESRLTKLETLKNEGFDSLVIKELKTKLSDDLKNLKSKLLSTTNGEELYKSLLFQSLTLERSYVHNLYHEGYIHENVYYDFDLELDLQQDALEYPEVFEGRAIEKGGTIHANYSYRQKIKKLERNIKTFPIGKSVLKESEHEIILERYELLRVRISSSIHVLSYLEKVEKLLGTNEAKKAVQKVKIVHEKYLQSNKKEVKEIETKNKKLVSIFQKEILNTVLQNGHTH